MAKKRYRHFRLVKLPIPGKRWPLDEMEVGESFLERDFSKWRALRVAASKAKTKAAKEGRLRAFTVRRTFEGIRVHRVE